MGRKTLGADKAYDTADFVEGCRKQNTTPHVAQNDTNRASAIDARTTRHDGHAISQNARRKQEGVFGWANASADSRARCCAGHRK